MNDWKWAITLAIFCCIDLTIAPSASADFLGITTVIKDDADTEFLCTQGNGDNVPGPLTVCNVSAVFDDPANVLLSVGNSDLHVLDSQGIHGLFFQHPFDGSFFAPQCSSIDFVSPDLICDTFITIGWKCSPDPNPENETPDTTGTSGSWSGFQFEFNGHVLGCWFNAASGNGQGLAGTWPDLQVLFLQSSVAQGLSLSGDIDIFWVESHPFTQRDVVAELDVLIECVATCGSCPTDVDGNGQVEAFDLANLLGKWGPVTSASVCLDADGNGLIEAFDLAVLLGKWGPCL